MVFETETFRSENKMRICPKCGFEDPICWHSYRWVTDIDYTAFQEFLNYYPQFKELRISEIVDDEHFFYRRSNRKNHGYFVFRWPKIFGEKYYNNRDYDRVQYARKVDQNQRKLLEPQK